MTRIHLSEQHRSIIRSFIKNEKMESLADLQFLPGLKKTLFYPTEDYALTRSQFELLTQLLRDDECLLILPLSWSGTWDDNEEVFTLSAPFLYEEYTSLPFATPALHFSSFGNWLLITDECLEGGTGIIAVSDHAANAFAPLFAESRADILRFSDFYLQDGQTRTGRYDFLASVIKMLL